MKNHAWTVDEDGVCEYDQGYLCDCGARKVVMAEGDTKHTPESALPCPGTTQAPTAGRYYVHWNGAAWFVKAAEFFKSQGGLTAPWGKAWTPIEAESIEHARVMAPLLVGTKLTHKAAQTAPKGPKAPQPK